MIFFTFACSIHAPGPTAPNMAMPPASPRQPAFEAVGTDTRHYSTLLFAERIVDIVDHHDPSQPLFMYFASQVCAPVLRQRSEDREVERKRERKREREETAHTHTHTGTHTDTETHTDTGAHTHRYTHRLTHKHTRTHTHTRARARALTRSL